MIPIPLMPKFSSQIKGTIQIISATQLHKAVVPPSFHRVRTGMTQNPLMASYTLCATRSKDASTNSNAHEGWQRDTTKQPQAILASFISYQQDYGSRVCQHDLVPLRSSGDKTTDYQWYFRTSASVGLTSDRECRSLVMKPLSMVLTTVSSNVKANLARASFSSSLARWARPRLQA